MAGPPVRERYNAKARGSVAGGGSHKKRKRTRIKEVADGERQLPTPGDEDEEEGGGDGRGKMSSKKRKRMDSYINKKLKSEERLKTIQLLASLAPSTSTSAALASTSSLGQYPMMPTSAAERTEKHEDKLVRRGIGRMEAKRGGGAGGSDSGSGSESESERKGRKGKGKAKEEIIEIEEDLHPEISKPAETSRASNGAAKPNKQPSKKSNWNPNLLSTQPESEDSSDFDSSDSAHDSSSEDGEQAEPADSVAPVAGPSLPPKSPSPPSRIVSPIDKTLVEESAPRKIIAPAGFGGALKKTADGSAVKPKVLPRRQKVPLGRNPPIDDESEEYSEGDDESGEADDDDDDSGSVSEEKDEDASEAEEEEDEGDVVNDADKEAKKRLGFKDWALRQMGQAPACSSGSPKPEPPPFAMRPPPSSSHLKPAPQTGEFVGPLGTQLAIPSSSLLDSSNQKASSSARPNIKRRPSVAESRMDLPILAEEQAIVEAIRMHPVVIIAGETGSGKTTQVPQMLYEAGFGFKKSDDPGMIAVTQPRRVAAVSLSERVRSELGLSPGSTTVAHQIRYSSTTSPNTAIKFMTDGVLLRELSSDFLLSRYSVIIVDEAHERGVNTDVLIGVLSRVAKLRERKWRDIQAKGDNQDSNQSSIRPLRIVIMSATLRIEDFAQNTTLFATSPPIIHIPARQHPVTVHFSKKTVSDYISEAYKKVCKIHARLPPGGILVFMTGQGEIQQLCRKLEKKYGAKATAKNSKSQVKAEAAEPNPLELGPEDQEAEDVELGNDEDLAADVDDGDAESDPEALDSDDDDDGLDVEIDEASDKPMHILPLYSLLSNEQQMSVFKPPPADHRLVIIATNVAETSLTIPGIRYVVDSGRSKERHYDISSGVQTFQVSWISKASASQRAGRAGRTGPGHCYRLYSSALFEDHFAKFSQPEILRMPIEGVVLQMKSMNIDQVINFPFPTPPDRVSLRKAEELLTHLGALERPTMTKMIGGTQQLGSVGGRITDLGKAMAGYPVSPRFAKMLCIGNQHECLPFVVSIVACLSVGDPFIHEQSIEEAGELGGVDDEDDDEDVRRGRRGEIGILRSAELKAKEERKDLRKKFFNAQSQFLGLGNGMSDLFKMLAAVGAYEFDPTPSFCSKHFLRLKAMQEIQQLRGQISAITKQSMTRLEPPTDTQLKVLRQIVTAASLDRVAVRLDIFLKKNTTFSSTRGVPYRAIGLGAEEVYIHPSSALFHRSPPEFLTYHEITRSAHSGKTWAKGITAINPAWLATLGKSLCTFSKPELAGMKVKGKGKLEEVKEGEREVLVTPHFGDLGVDLPVVRMKQRREGTRWVLVE